MPTLRMDNRVRETLEKLVAEELERIKFERDAGSDDDTELEVESNVTHFPDLGDMKLGEWESRIKGLQEELIPNLVNFGFWDDYPVDNLT